MSNWLGSHWRWRGAMVCIAVALLGYGWWQAGRWRFRQLVGHGASPAIYRTVYRDGSQSLEAFDWKLGRYWTLAQIEPTSYPEEVAWLVRVSRDGKVVVWRHGTEVHAVNIQSPSQRQSYQLPFSNPRHKLVGLSRDARFGVFQGVGVRRVLPDGQSTVSLFDDWTGFQPVVYVLSVVELKSGRIVSSREWGSSIVETNIVGADEFRSYLVASPPADPMEPVRGLWKLTEDGEWELLERAQLFKFQYVSLLRQPMGEWRLVEDLASLPGDAELVNPYVFGTFDSGKRFVANGVGRDYRTYAGNFDTKEAFEIGPGEASTGTAVAIDGSYAVVSDRRDDITVYDLKTGKVIARDAAGSSRRNHLLGVGIALLVLAAMWARMGLAESKLPWGAFDALAAILLTDAAVFPIHTSFFYPYLTTPLPFDFFGVIPSFLLRGAFVGGTILTGWYWAHGREWFAVRWLLGTLWLTALSVPLVVLDQNAAVYYDLTMILRAWVVAGLVASGLTAALAILFRPLGWSARAAEESRSLWRFGLMQLFSLTASVGIALVLIQSLLELPGLISLLGISDWPAGSFCVGIPLAGILFLRSRWAIALGVVASVAIGLAGTYWYVEAWRFSFPSKPDRYLGEGIALASTLLAIVLPCLVLRRHGWRWTKVGSVEALAEAAA